MATRTRRKPVALGAAGTGRRRSIELRRRQSMPLGDIQNRPAPFRQPASLGKLLAVGQPTDRRPSAGLEPLRRLSQLVQRSGLIGGDPAPIEQPSAEQVLRRVRSNLDRLRRADLPEGASDIDDDADIFELGGYTGDVHLWLFELQLRYQLPADFLARQTDFTHSFRAT